MSEAPRWEECAGLLCLRAQGGWPMAYLDLNSRAYALGMFGDWVKPPEHVITIDDMKAYVETIARLNT